MTSAKLAPSYEAAAFRDGRARMFALRLPVACRQWGHGPVEVYDIACISSTRYRVARVDTRAQ